MNLPTLMTSRFQYTDLFKNEVMPLLLGTHQLIITYNNAEHVLHFKLDVFIFIVGTLTLKMYGPSQR